ncbi:hypothetical protein D3C86_1990250 [compost metagenome]
MDVKMQVLTLRSMLELADAAIVIARRVLIMTNPKLLYRTLSRSASKLSTSDLSLYIKIGEFSSKPLREISFNAA